MKKERWYARTAPVNLWFFCALSVFAGFGITWLLQYFGWMK